MISGLLELFGPTELDNLLQVENIIVLFWFGF